MPDSIAQASNEVKKPNVLARSVAWIDSHPRTGWYVASVVTLNLLVNLVNLFS